MSKKNEKEVIEINPEEEVATEQVEETVEEKKPNKVLSVVKKLAPFAVLGGIVAAAFALGKSSGSDAAYLEMLGNGESDGGSDETDESDDITDHEDETEEK